MSESNAPSPLYDHEVVSAAYFFGRPTSPLPEDDHAERVPLRLEDGTEIAAWRLRVTPGKPRPVLLYLYGNGETASDQLMHWPAWAGEAGLDLLLVDYPGYGASGGRATFGGCAEAARVALAHLLARPADDVASVIVAGRSAGSIFAIDAAAAHADEKRVAAVLLESGIAELTGRLADRAPWAELGLDRERLIEEVARDFDHAAKLATLRCPVLVLHTRHDGIVPVEHGERLAAFAGDRLHRLVLFENGDHNSIQLINEGGYREALAELVERVTG